MKKIRKQRKILLFISVIVFTVFGLFLNESISVDNHEDAETIVFLGNEGLAPIIYDDNGKAKGISADIAEELGNKMDVKIEVEAMDWVEAQNKVLTHEADALLQINSNPIRETLYDFSDEVLKSEFAIFIKSGNRDIKSIDDLVDKNVAVEKGGYPYTLLTNHGGINLEVVNDWDTGFTDVASGKIDAIVVDKWIGEFELAKGDIENIEVIDEPIETHYSRIAVKKDNDELLNSINLGLKEMNNDGTMAAILSNWSSKRVVYLTEEVIRKRMIRALLVIIGLLLLIASYLINKYRRLSQKLEADVTKRAHELRLTNELLREANAELAMMAMMDGLTGLTNRRGFDLAYEKAWETSKREKQTLALIMIDIDHFKQFNDTYGHLVGDGCLIRVAQKLKSFLNETGHLISRFGGEEFIILLFDTNEDTAAVLAEEMRKEVEALEIEESNITSEITISLGVAATIPNDNLHPESLIDIADKALYQAKKEGRNKVLVGKLT